MSSRVFVTGQQIGLMGGPLYTTWKILGAASLATEHNGKAIFWMETNDADFEEIRHIHGMDRQNNLFTLSWDRDTGGRSTGFIPVDQQLRELLKNWFDRQRETDFTGELRKLVMDSYRKGTTLGEASFELFRRLFGQFGVEPFDPSAAGFLKDIRPILEKECRETKPGNQCHAFARTGEIRQALFRTADGFQLRNGKPVTLDDVALLPDRDTRPLCQDAFFTPEAYVAGPAEARYLTELAPLYEKHGIRRSRIQPRMTLTLVEPRASRLLERTGLDAETVLSTDKVNLRKQMLAKAGGVDLDRLQGDAHQLKTAFLSQLDNLELNDTAFRKALERELKGLLGRKRASVKERNEQTTNDVTELSDRLRPFDRPQERIFPIFQYMNYHGGMDLPAQLLANHAFDTRIEEINHA